MKRMKLVVTGTLVAMWTLLVPVAARAQDPLLHFGVIAGSNLSNVEWVPQQGFALDRLRKFDAGFLADLRLNHVLSLETRLMWLRQGTDAVLSRNPSIHVVYTIDSAALPVLLRIRASTGRFRPYVMAGPQLALKLRATALSDVVGQRTEEPLTGDDVKSIDVALNAGGGVEIPAGRGSLFLEAGYSRGLRNMAVLQAGDDLSQSIKTRTVLLAAGVRF